MWWKKGVDVCNWVQISKHCRRNKCCKTNLIKAKEGFTKQIFDCHYKGHKQCTPYQIEKCKHVSLSKHCSATRCCKILIIGKKKVLLNVKIKRKNVKKLLLKNVK